MLVEFMVEVVVPEELATMAVVVVVQSGLSGAQIVRFQAPTLLIYKIYST